LPVAYAGPSGYRSLCRKKTYYCLGGGDSSSERRVLGGIRNLLAGVHFPKGDTSGRNPSTSARGRAEGGKNRGERFLGPAGSALRVRLISGLDFAFIKRKESWNNTTKGNLIKRQPMAVSLQRKALATQKANEGLETTEAVSTLWGETSRRALLKSKAQSGDDQAFRRERVRS